QEVYKYQATRDDNYVSEWQNFIACIKQGAEPLITGEDGLKVLQIIDAARLAAKSKSQVKNR
ncbi:Gfo/Idh/MocA family oxidoreductase, partial [Porticoccaceae bacterium]|nr:Gfo/Idh/MocA family oxidoreductase [Porticoccaceae bacterium]